MPSFQEFQDRSRFLLLDGIRALAIIAVIWHHSSGVDPFDSEFFQRGYLGVDLFFLLSGFLITHLLIKEKRKTGKISIKKFYMRRTLRIFPLYYTYIALFGVLTYVNNRESFGDYVESLPYYLLYISNWAPDHIWHFFHRAWSLAVEEQFYLFWPILIGFLGFLIPARAIIILVTLSLIIFTGILGDQLIEAARIAVPFRTILIGCLLAIVLNNSKGYGFVTPYMNKRWHSALWLTLLVTFIFIQSGPILDYAQLTVHLLMALFLGSCIVQENNVLAGLLKQKILVTIGIVSYGIYILHGQFWGATQSIVRNLPVDYLAQSKISFFIVFMALSLIVALFSFHFFESQFLKLKKYYATLNKA